MAIHPPPSHTLADTQPPPFTDPGANPELLERSFAHELSPARWIGGRTRMLVAIALLACLALFLLARSLAEMPNIDGLWRVDPLGRVELVAAHDPALAASTGSTVEAILSDQGRPVAIDHLLQQSSRWLVDDLERHQRRVQQDALEHAVHSGAAVLQFNDGRQVRVASQPRGVAGLGAMFWVMCLFALVLFQAGAVALLAVPSLRGALYALMATCQAGTLLAIALEAVPGLGAVPGIAHTGDARTAFDLLTAAAVAHASGLHPRLMPSRHAVATVAWITVAALLALMAAGQVAHIWWWTQGVMVGLGLLAVVQLSWSYRLRPHPLAGVLARFAGVAVATLVLLSAAAAAARVLPLSPYQVTAVGATVWHVFFASLVLLVPLLSRPQQVVREFALLAGISTAATSLDLLFVAVFSLEQATSLTLSLFAALGLYAAARQWLMRQMLGNDRLTAERMFEQLYRIAREVQTDPHKLPDQLALMLHDLFEPLEVLQIDRTAERTQVVGEGSGLLVPVPRLGGTEATRTRAIVLRFANRGRRVFTSDDARLAERIVEQLERATAYERAVEQGRSEERSRIAQDLHDDIGARLLTLMYQAPTREMEEYLRHTLQDLKTLSRGLAATGHRLSHSAAEWKNDLTQRLSAAQCELGWSFAADADAALSVVEWSALTRVLRELVSNAIAHAHATRLDVELSYEHEHLTLVVTDNGGGRAPESWSHGLGLGGVRKRVKQLGGEVQWIENAGVGIQCRVVVPRFGRRMDQAALA